MNKKIITIIITLLAIIVLAVFLFFYIKKEDKKNSEIEKDVFMTEILLGDISQIGENYILVSVRDNQIADEEKADNVKIYIDDKTKFKRYTGEIKSAEEFKKEQSDFQAALKEQGAGKDYSTTLESPDWYKTESIGFNNLAVNDKVRIVSSKKSDNSYIAKTIIVENKKQIQDADQPVIKDSNVIVSGTIDSIGGQTINLKDSESTYFVASGKIIKVLFDEKTSIIAKKQKTDEKFTQEQVEFNKKIENLRKENKSIYGLAAPQPYIENQESQSYFRVEQKLIIYGSINTANEEMLADKIEIIEQIK